MAFAWGDWITSNEGTSELKYEVREFNDLLKGRYRIILKPRREGDPDSKGSISRGEHYELIKCDTEKFRRFE